MLAHRVVIGGGLARELVQLTAHVPGALVGRAAATDVEDVPVGGQVRHGGIEPLAPVGDEARVVLQDEELLLLREQARGPDRAVRQPATDPRGGGEARAIVGETGRRLQAEPRGVDPAEYARVDAALGEVVGRPRAVADADADGQHVNRPFTTHTLCITTATTLIVSVTITDSREDEIADAVRSVVDHVDRVLLVDTGVTDQTLLRAAEVAGEKFAASSHAWTDFSAARNASLAEAEALGGDWIVIVDSDERFDFGKVDLRAALAKTTAEILLVESADGHYPKEKILRAGCGFRFVGPTHEVLHGGRRQTLDGVVFAELPKTDAQARTKMARDVAILIDHLEKDPSDPRWWYYLGQSLEGLGERERAVDAFEQCVDRRRFTEEAAWAAYKQAEQLFILERHEDAVLAAARGMAADATFAECAWIAAASACKLGRIAQGIAWARAAEAVGRYRGCGGPREFFRHMPALYELPYDVLRFALPEGPLRVQAEVDFHAAKRARVGATDLHDLDRISVSRDVSSASRDEVRSMLRPEPLADTCPSARATRIQFEPPNGWHPMNPGLCQHEGSIWCVVRTVNYAMTGRQYTIDDPDGIVRTQNYLGRLSPRGELLDASPMLDLDPSPRQPSTILGYEDVRLVSVGGKIEGSATVCDRDASRRLIAHLHLNSEGNVQGTTLQPNFQIHEKNWMPFALGGEIAWIYAIDDTRVLKLDHLRGGAALVLNDGGLLCVTHEVVESNETRIYLHRFVRLDAKFDAVAVSPAWVFAHHGIEFCAGIVRDGGQYVLSYGVGDREAWILRVDVEEVEAMRWIAP